jgi:hypothetical protein
VKLFQKLSAVNQDTVWLKLINMWYPVDQLNPPVDGLKIIKVIGLIFYHARHNKVKDNTVKLKHVSFSFQK